MVSVALSAVPTITMTYVVDSLLLVNVDALMFVNGMFPTALVVIKWLPRLIENT